MLNKIEKDEMLKDAKSISRCNDFRISKQKNMNTAISDNYFAFLNNIQKILSPFKISNRITITKLNKL